MSVQALAIQRIGLMSAVGADAASSCAALRAKVSNPSPTKFMNSTGEWILAHQTPLPPELKGLARQVAMAVAVIEEALSDVRSEDRAANAQGSAVVFTASATLLPGMPATS